MAQMYAMNLGVRIDERLIIENTVESRFIHMGRHPKNDPLN